MDQGINQHSSHVESQDESDFEDEAPFNCAPVKKVIVNCSERAPEQIRFPTNIRDLGVRFNVRRQTTLRGPIKGLTTAYVDQDTSGTWHPDSDRVTPTIRRPQRKRREPEETEPVSEQARKQIDRNVNATKPPLNDEEGLVRLRSTRSTEENPINGIPQELQNRSKRRKTTRTQSQER